MMHEHMADVARILLGEPNKAISSKTELRYGTRGSLSIDLAKGTWYDHEAGIGGGVADLIRARTGATNGGVRKWMEDHGLGSNFTAAHENFDGARHVEARNGAARTSEPKIAPKRIVATYDYRDELGELLFQVVRYDPKDFRQRRPVGDGWDWHVKGVRQVPYRLEDITNSHPDDPVWIVEGEKDADRLASLGLIATCNAGGAGKWPAELSRHFTDRIVRIIPDGDKAGRAHASAVEAALCGTASEVVICELPGGSKDVSEHLDGGGSVSDIVFEDDGPFKAWGIEELDEGDIPPREWLLSTALCRKYVTVIAASGGVGKTTLMLMWALSLASGKKLIGEHVHKRSRVLLLTFEDDVEEYRRRLRAARMHHDVGRVGDEWLKIIPLAGLGVRLAEVGDHGVVAATGVDAKIMQIVRRFRIDAILIDPFVKLSDSDENDNKATDFVTNLLVGLAHKTNTAIGVAHHFRKGLAEAGNIDSARGARSLIDAARLAYTMLPMSKEEAQEFGASEEERVRLVRLDDGKYNIKPPAVSAQWYRLVSVSIGNGTTEYPAGDNVQAIETWIPPDKWAALTTPIVHAILDQIDAGEYSTAAAAKARAAWKVVVEHIPQFTEAQARDVIDTWVRNGLLINEEFYSKARRENALRAISVPSKRPV